jgi:uncharacterized membrane protein YcaP (DUF421 family)
MSTVTSLLIVAASTAAVYAFLVMAMRLWSRRQLGQLTVIDLVVLLVLGSAVETAMIHGDTTLPAGLVSASTLLVANRALTWAFRRSERLRHLVGAGPVLVVHNGRPVADHLRRLGMTETDLAEALRGRGYDSPAGIRFGVVEADGTLSVVPESPTA